MKDIHLITCNDESCHNIYVKIDITYGETIQEVSEISLLWYNPPHADIDHAPIARQIRPESPKSACNSQDTREGTVEPYDKPGHYINPLLWD